MDLLTYLGAKKGKFTLPYKNDLVSFLIGKKASSLPEQTASGTTIEITAKKKNIVELTLDHMCEQTGTPTPSDPKNIVVADGFSNLFNGLLRQGNQNDNTVTSRVFMGQNDFYINEGDVITFSTDLDTSIYSYSFYIYENPYLTPSNTQLYTSSYQTTSSFTLTAGYTGYLGFAIKKIEGGDITPSDFTSNHFQIETGNVVHPYVSYGNNYINLVITNGIETTNNLINLGNNFIGGIGDYKDKLTIDDQGHVSLVKYVNKIILDENSTVGKNKQTENYYQFYASIDGKQYGNNFITNKLEFDSDLSSIYQCAGRSTSDRIIFNLATTDCVYSANGCKGWLENNNVLVYYVMEEATTIDLGTVDIELFKGANIITNSDNCNMVLKYY